MVKAINSRFLFFLFIILSLFYLSLFLFQENFEISQQRTILKDEIKKLRLEMYGLESQNSVSGLAGSSLQGPGDYLEKVAREDLNLKKAGEQSVVVQLPDIPLSQKNNFSSQEKINFWEKIWARVAQW